MKKMKKMMALALAMVMVFAMSMTVFAAGEGSLTVKNSEKDVTYDFYRILDLTGQDTDTTDTDTTYDAVVYKLNSKWTAFWTTGDGASYISTTNDTTANGGKGYATINVDGTIKYITLTESNRVEFTNKAMKYAIDNSIVRDATVAGDAAGADVEVANLDLGYYLMIPVDMTDEKTNPLTTGSIASLTSTIPEADIYVKATKPEVKKTDNVVSADIGQTVTYTLEGKMPNTSGTTSYIYKLQDEMTTGLTFNKDVAVTIEGVTNPITSQCTIDYSTVTNGFVCTIPVATLQGTNGANIGKKITLTYTATVNENAIQSTNEKNKAKVIYGRNPQDLEESIPVEEELYSANIEIIKYTGENATSGTKLPNASFALMNSEGKYYHWVEATGTEGQDGYVAAHVEWVTVTGAPTDGTANVTDAQAKALADATTITTKTTTADGTATFEGIKDGTYYLVEYAAPAGYNRLDKPQTVTVTGKNVDDGTNRIENTAYAGQTEFDEAIDATAEVLNQSGSVLPSTGGIGTTIFYIVGAILVLGAGILLVTRRRMNAN